MYRKRPDERTRKVAQQEKNERTVSCSVWGQGNNAAIRSARKSATRVHSHESVYFIKLTLKLCVRATQGLTHYQTLFLLSLFRVSLKIAHLTNASIKSSKCLHLNVQNTPLGVMYIQYIYPRPTCHQNCRLTVGLTSQCRMSVSSTAHCDFPRGFQQAHMYLHACSVLYYIVHAIYLGSTIIIKLKVLYTTD